MKVSVEFNGIFRILTKASHLSLELPPGTTFREIIKLLGERYPVLAGEVLDSEKGTLIASNALSLNGKCMVRLAELDDAPQEGDRLIFMSVLAGG
ncbi:MAG: MoaD/ThiS family protein [Anaerolineales bacterium]